ncbi:MAG: preprotein translocase YidC [Ignavibacteria bacterium RBG_16_34_14]|nr:MAG: preprotein translocase YidC [Ignavibacteria bacterium RBG_16_34_14]
MDKQTILAFVIIGAILIIWLYLNTPTPPPQKVIQQKDTTEVLKDTIAKTIEQKREIDLKEAEKDTQSLGKYFEYVDKQERIITVENDVAVIELSTRGANLRKYFLKEFNNWYSAEADTATYETMVQLINHSMGNPYDLAFVTTDGKAINTNKLNFSSTADRDSYRLTDTDSLTLEFSVRAGENGEIKKMFTFYGNKYNILSNIQLIGLNNIISNNAYDFVWQSGIRFVEENSVDEANFSNASVYYGEEQVIIDASDVGETVEEDFTGRVDWLGIRNKYFAAIIAPQDPSGVDGAYIKGYREQTDNAGIKEVYSGRFIIPFKNADIESKYFNIYIGPVDYGILKEYENHFEAIVDFGSFFGLKFIVRPVAEFVLLPLFNFLHGFIPNYGIVIIVFSIIIKIVIYPLTKQSMQSMKKMQLLQPKINEIKEKFKDDPQKMNKETMKLYSTYGVNPAGGCFPLLLQMPIFIALWGLFQIAIDLRQQHFVGWITDLSRPDVIAKLPFKLPIFGIDQIAGLALLMGITTFVQQKMSIKDPKQAALVYIMPVMLTILFMSFPSGLNLYYFMFNILSIGQQYYINHKHDGMVLEPVKNPKKKKGFMSRLMEAAEQKQQQQRKKR